MKCPLLALGLALACGVQAAHIPQTAEDLDLRKVAGTWHVVAMAASNMFLLDAESGPLRVYVEELEPTPQGDLEVLLQKWENHECVEKTLMAQKTEDPAVFTVDCHGERKISMLDTDYSSYMIFFMEGPTPTDEGSVWEEIFNNFRTLSDMKATLKVNLLTEVNTVARLPLLPRGPWSPGS